MFRVFGHLVFYDRAVTPFLDRQALLDDLVGTRWSPVDLVAATGSTNADVAARARAGAPDGLVEITGWQRAGRGRFTRVWETPPDTCVAMSALVRPTAPLAAWGWLSLVVGMAVADGLRAASGLDARLKWPNDVLIGERKICGILSEAVMTDADRAAVLGMGINVALAEEQLPVPTATSVRIEGSDASATAVAGGVLKALDHWYRRWDAGESLTDAYLARCSTIGRRVRVQLAEGAVEGEAVSVDASGSLIVATASSRQAFSAGDVVHLRPGD